MAAALTPVASIQTGESLSTVLDNLWAQYLSLLDQYQDLRQRLASDLSAGYVNLAKANFTNPNRVRYGKDYYDERMQASVGVSSTGEALFRRIELSTRDEIPLEEIKEPDSIRKSSTENVPRGTELTSGDEKEGKSKTESKARDPLNWFGILVPPTLRVSQAAFKDAVTKIAELSALDVEMRAVEIEIRRTRKKLGKIQ